MNARIEELLNNQIKYEAQASIQYLAMASWADAEGYNGVAEFFYNQSEEERTHMTKLVKFVNERSGNGGNMLKALQHFQEFKKALKEIYDKEFEDLVKVASVLHVNMQRLNDSSSHGDFRVTNVGH